MKQEKKDVVITIMINLVIKITLTLTKIIIIMIVIIIIIIIIIIIVINSWINECMEMFGIAENLRTILQKSMQQWRLSLTTNA